MTVKNFNCDDEEENDFKQRKMYNKCLLCTGMTCLPGWMTAYRYFRIDWGSDDVDYIVTTKLGNTFEPDEILSFCPNKIYLFILQSLISITGGTCQNWGAMHRGRLLSIYGHALPRCCQWWSLISMIMWWWWWYKSTNESCQVFP